jgi:SSS family solute:Na+ symporter
VLGLFGGGLAGVFALGIFTRRAHGTGALIGLVAGSALVLWVQQYTRLHFFLYAAIGIAGCFLLGYLVSLMLPAPKKTLDGLTIYTIK